MANPVVTFEMENGDIMKAELYPEIAPNTVKNFISLINKGFYDVLKDFDADYLFSTMQMMAKPEILSKFQRDEFETIIIDEYDIIGLSREAA